MTDKNGPEVHIRKKRSIEDLSIGEGGWEMTVVSKPPEEAKTVDNASCLLDGE